MEHRSFMGALAEEALRLAPGVATIMDTNLKAIGCGCRVTAYEATYKLRSEGATDKSSVIFRLDSDLRLISVSQQEL